MLGYTLHMFLTPDLCVREFTISPSMHIADFGAGSGAFTLALARVLTENGKVYAIEVQKELLTRIRTSAQKEGLTNVETVWGNIEKKGGSKLADHALDGVLVSNVLFQVPDRDGLLQEVFRVLKPGGKVYIIDWSDSFGGMGPTSDAVIGKNAARALIEKNHFTYEKDFDPGSHHWGMIFKKS